MVADADYWWRLAPDKDLTRQQFLSMFVAAYPPDLQGLEGLDRKLAINIVVGASRSAYYRHMWAAYGKNLFDLRGDLAAALLLTDPDPGPVRLPYPSVVLRIPTGVVPVFSRDAEKKWATLIIASEDGPDLCLSALSVDNLDPVGFVFDPVTHRPPDGNWDPDPDAADSRRWLLGEDALTGSAVFRVVANLTSWLEAHPAEKKRQHRIRRKKLKDRSWPTVWVTGNEVRLGVLRAAASEYAVGGSRRAKPGWRLRMQHVVRGHWKRQPHGPQSSLRRRVWVEPYLRGPEAKAAWAHVYKGGSPG